MIENKDVYGMIKNKFECVKKRKRTYVGEKKRGDREKGRERERERERERRYKYTDNGRESNGSKEKERGMRGRNRKKNTVVKI